MRNGNVSVRIDAKIRPAFGPSVSGDACVALGWRFCVLQLQRGASPAANQDTGLICAPILNSNPDEPVGNGRRSAVY